MRSELSLMERIKKPLYGFFFGVGTALGGERALTYAKKKYREQKDQEIEEIADKVIEKYREEIIRNPRLEITEP